MKPTIRASEADRRLWCSGSRTLEAIVEPRPSDETSSEGQWLHFLIAVRLVAELGATPPEGGLKAPSAVRPPGVNNALWVVDLAIRQVQEQIPADWSLEVEFGWSYEFDQFILSGHPDVMGMSPDGKRMKIIDWKCGRIPVDHAESNEQSCSHVVLGKRAFPEVEEIEFTFCQPFNDEDEGFQRITSVTVSDLIVEGVGERAPMLDGLVQVFEQRINAALANPMALSTGNWCKYCAAATQCPAIIALRKLMKLSMTPEELAAITATPNDAVLGDWAVDAKTLAGPIKDATELLHARLDKVTSITAGSGVHISREIQRGAYEVLDAPQFYREVCTLIPEPAKRAGVLSFSMTRLTDTIAEVLGIPKTGKAANTAEGVFDAKLRPLVKQGERRLLRFR